MALFDGLDSHLLALDRDRLRLAQVAIGQAADFRRHGGGEQRRLAIGRRGAQNGLDVVDEAHAQHFVGLVEHDGLHLAQVQRLALDEVEQAPRRADDDVDALVETADLAAIGFAAIDGQHADVALAAKVMHGLGNLDGQFARRHEHQALHGAGARFQPVQDRQRKGGRLARAGLGLADHIVTFQHDGNHCGLNRRRRGKAKRLDGLHQLRVQAQMGKSGSHLKLL